MTFKSNGCDSSMHPDFDSQRRHESDSHSSSSSSLDNLKRDRFELLSAYLDGEVTPQERRQVEHWLRVDRTMQCLYTRLLQLRCQIQTMPIPKAERSVEDTVEAVYKRLDRRPRRYLAWGGAAVAAVFCALISTNLPSFNYASNRIDEDIIEQSESDVPTDALVISLDQPVIDIPQASSIQGETWVDSATPSEDLAPQSEETL